MKVTLGGAFENALLRGITLQRGEQALALDHPYYASLYRRTPAAYFDRSATFSVIAENLMLPMVDWTARGMGELKDYRNEIFGIEIVSEPDNRSHYDNIAKFSELVLASREIG